MNLVHLISHSEQNTFTGREHKRDVENALERTETPKQPVVKVPRSKRRGLFARFAIVAEVTEPRDYPDSTKWFLVAVIGFAAAAAPVGSSIILPSLDLVSKQFGSSPATTNLSVALYMLAMAIFPLWWSALSEAGGRRTVYLTSFAMFTVFAVLSATSQNIAMLVIMRMLSGGGAASVQAVGAGTVADLFDTGERGRAMGIFYLGPLCGPLFAPILGGIVGERWGWRATQWVLAIYGVMAFVCLFFGLPETLKMRKKIVESSTIDDSLPSQTSSLRRTATRQSVHKTWKKYFKAVKVLLLDPIKIVLYLRYPPVLLSIYYASVTFGSLYVLNISVSYSFKREPYNFGTLIVGLFYIPNSLGYVISSILGGLWMDRIMKREARRANRRSSNGKWIYLPEDRMCENAWLGAALYPTALIWYGWTTEKGVFVIWPLIANFFYGLGSLLIFAMVTTMLTEFMPRKASSGVALNNLCTVKFEYAIPPVFQYQKIEGPITYSNVATVPHERINFTGRHTDDLFKYNLADVEPGIIDLGLPKRPGSHPDQADDDISVVNEHDSEPLRGDSEKPELRIQPHHAGESESDNEGEEEQASEEEVETEHSTTRVTEPAEEHENSTADSKSETPAPAETKSESPSAEEPTPNDLESSNAETVEDVVKKLQAADAPTEHINKVLERALSEIDADDHAHGLAHNPSSYDEPAKASSQDHVKPEDDGDDDDEQDSEHDEGTHIDPNTAEATEVKDENNVSDEQAEPVTAAKDTTPSDETIEGAGFHNDATSTNAPAERNDTSPHDHSSELLEKDDGVGAAVAEGAASIDKSEEELSNKEILTEVLAEKTLEEKLSKNKTFTKESSKKTPKEKSMKKEISTKDPTEKSPKGKSLKKDTSKKAPITQPPKEKPSKKETSKIAPAKQPSKNKSSKREVPPKASVAKTVAVQVPAVQVPSEQSPTEQTSAEQRPQEKSSKKETSADAPGEPTTAEQPPEKDVSKETSTKPLAEETPAEGTPKDAAAVNETIAMEAIATIAAKDPPEDTSAHTTSSEDAVVENTTVADTSNDAPSDVSPKDRTAGEDALGVGDVPGENTIPENPVVAKDTSSTKDKPAPAAEDKPAPTTEDKPAPTAEDTPAPTAEDKPAPTTEDKPAPAAEDKPAPAAEDKPAPTAEDKPAPTAEDTPASTAEDKPAPTTEDKPAPAAEDKPAPTAEDTPAPTAEDKPAPTTEDKPAPAAEDKPAPAAEDKPAPTTEDKPAPTAEDKPAPTAEDKPAPTTEDKPAPAAEDKPAVEFLQDDKDTSPAEEKPLLTSETVSNTEDVPDAESISPGEPMDAEQAPAAKDPPAIEDSSPPAEETPPTEEATPSEDVPSTEEAAPVKDIPHETKDVKSPTEEAHTAKDASATEDTPSPTKDAPDAKDIPATGDTPPPTEDSPATKDTPNTEGTPKDTPPAEDIPVAKDAHEDAGKNSPAENAPDKSIAAGGGDELPASPPLSRGSSKSTHTHIRGKSHEQYWERDRQMSIMNGHKMLLERKKDERGLFVNTFARAFDKLKDERAARHETQEYKEKVKHRKERHEAREAREREERRKAHEEEKHREEIKAQEEAERQRRRKKREAAKRAAEEEEHAKHEKQKQSAARRKTRRPSFEGSSSGHSSGGSSSKPGILRQMTTGESDTGGLLLIAKPNKPS
ncbi:hypothetical protein DV736_g4923, partial [Chaetothyriales sp. CBS 134916]